MHAFYSFPDEEVLSPALQALVQKTSTRELLTAAQDLKSNSFHWTPLHLLRAAIRRGDQTELFTHTFNNIVRTPRDLADLYSLYGSDPLAAAFRRCTERAFQRFTAAELLRGPGALKRLMQRAHPRPLHKEQSQVWGRFLAQ